MKMLMIMLSMQDGNVQPDLWSAWRWQWNKKSDALLAKT